MFVASFVVFGGYISQRWELISKLEEHSYGSELQKLEEGNSRSRRCISNLANFARVTNFCNPDEISQGCEISEWLRNFADPVKFRTNFPAIFNILIFDFFPVSPRVIMLTYELSGNLY